MAPSKISNNCKYHNFFIQILGHRPLKVVVVLMLLDVALRVVALVAVVVVIITVETRWEVKAIHGGGCHVKVYCSVPFSKSTMLRSQIVRGAFDESRAGHVLMLKMARESISQMQVQERAPLVCGEGYRHRHVRGKGGGGGG